MSVFDDAARGPAYRIAEGIEREFIIRAMACFDGGECGEFMVRVLTGAFCPWPRREGWSRYAFQLA